MYFAKIIAYRAVQNLYLNCMLKAGVFVKLVIVPVLLSRRRSEESDCINCFILIPLKMQASISVSPKNYKLLFKELKALIKM